MSPTRLLTLAESQAQAKARRFRELEKFHAGLAAENARRAEECETMAANLQKAQQGLEEESCTLNH